MKNILIIGGTGFLGSAIVRELARRRASADFSLESMLDRMEATFRRAASP